MVLDLIVMAVLPELLNTKSADLDLPIFTVPKSTAHGEHLNLDAALVAADASGLSAATPFPGNATSRRVASSANRLRASEPRGRLVIAPLVFL